MLDKKEVLKKIKIVNFDIKNGGMVAPLIPKFHQYLFGSENSKKIIFNIGGIANGTYLDNKKIMLASDVGPGNCLMDLVATKRLDSNFDLKGETASKGKIIESLLKMLHASCAHLDYPRADDKQDYYKILNTNFDRYQTEDILRTLAEFTADKVCKFFNNCGSPEEVIFHGGGINNNFLMNLIEEKLKVLAFGLLITNLEPDKSSTKSKVEPYKYGYDIESNNTEKFSKSTTSSSKAPSESNLNPY